MSQLCTDYSSISVVPEVITHCPPLVIDAHLHSTLILIGASNQTNITICADATDIDCDIETQMKRGSSNDNHVHTLTSHSSTPTAGRTTDKEAMWTVNEATLTTTAVNLIQVGCTRASTKNTAEENCTCQHKNQNQHYFNKCTIIVDINIPWEVYPNCWHTTSASTLPQES